MTDKGTTPPKTLTHRFQQLQMDLAAIIQSTPAGERMPSENELTVQLSVSRSTLREAIRSFEGRGLVRRCQGLGTFVVGPSPVIESGLEVLESIETLAGRIQLKVAMGNLEI
jgi:GntR family transcriptional regulator